MYGLVQVLVLDYGTEARPARPVRTVLNDLAEAEGGVWKGVKMLLLDVLEELKYCRTLSVRADREEVEAWADDVFYASEANVTRLDKGAEHDVVVLDNLAKDKGPCCFENCCRSYAMTAHVD